MNDENKKVIIVDMDGTLALKSNRGIFDYSKVSEDTLNIPVAQIVKAMVDSYDYKVIITSGRDDSCWRTTMIWLEENKIPVHRLYMRKTGDKRGDDIVKEEIYRESIEGMFDVIFVLDDRDRVVKMWRELGLICLQVRDGDF